jgi:sugar phosphate isomerase/epimerase
MKRRNFIKHTGQFGIGLSLLGLSACAQNQKKKEGNSTTETMLKEDPMFFKLSLAQWSIHKAIHDGSINPMDFAEKAKGWGFAGLEYVNHLYNKELAKSDNKLAGLQKLVKDLNQKAADHQMENLIIMIDGEGALATADDAKRKAAVENHHKWVDAAAGLGCHSIRVNLQGDRDLDIWVENSAKGLSELATYAAKSNINILVENHGGFSSIGNALARVMKTVNLSNCGTLPDFGNFCYKRGKDESGKTICLDGYDKYQGVKDLMPFAKAVSAKSRNFDAAGNEIDIDYTKMLSIVKKAGYKGFIGVEYEGSTLSEEAGILATRDLLIKVAKELA